MATMLAANAAAAATTVLHTHTTARLTTTTTTTTVAAAPQLPTAVQLRDASDVQLSALLFDAYRVLRVTAAPAPLDTAWVATLLTPRLLRSTSPDVAQLVACVLCDVVRLAMTPSLSLTTTTTTTTTPQLPFALTACDDVLQCLVQPFAALTRAAPDHGAVAAATTTTATATNNNTALSGDGRELCGSLQSCEYVIERLAASHAMLHLLPHCSHHVDTPSRLQTLFDAVAYASPPSSQQQQQQQQRADALTAATTTTTTTCVAFSRVLGDVLHANNSITTAQLLPLLTALTRHSHALHNHTSTKSKSNNNNNSSNSNSSNEAGSAVIARHVLLDHADMIQPALVAALMPRYEHGVQEVCAADVLATTTAADSNSNSNSNNGGVAAVDDDEKKRRALSSAAQQQQPLSLSASQQAADSRRRGLQQMAHVMEALVATTELHAPLTRQLVAHVLPYMRHAHDDVRLLTLRGCAAALRVSDDAAVLYTSSSSSSNSSEGNVLAALLARGDDVKPALRTEATLQLGRLMQTACACGWRASVMAHLWQQLQPSLTRRLVDVHALVRRQAVHTYCDVLLAAPQLCEAAALTSTTTATATTTTQGGGGATTAVALWRVLGSRTLDRHVRVREAATTRLAELYRTLLLSWVPACVLRAVHAEQGAALVQAILEQLLPPPTQQQQQRTAANNSSSSNSSSSTNAVFAFERAYVRQEQTYALALVRLCADVCAAQTMMSSSNNDGSDDGYAVLLGLVRQRVQLRKAIARLLQLRVTARAMALTTHDSNNKGDSNNKKSDDDVCMSSSSSSSSSPHAAIHTRLVDDTHRLLRLVCDATHSEHGEWAALLRSGDAHITDALLQATSAHECDCHADWLVVRNTLLQSLRGHADARLLSFVQQHVAQQILLPLQPTHVHELVDALQRHTHATRSTTTTSSNDGSEGNNNTATTNVLRALLLVAVAAPALLTRHVTALLAVLEHVARTLHTQTTTTTTMTAMTTSQQPLQCLRVLFDVLVTWSSWATRAHTQLQQQSTSSSPSTQRQRQAKQQLQQMTTLLAHVSTHTRQTTAQTLHSLCLADEATTTTTIAAARSDDEGRGSTRGRRRTRSNNNHHSTHAAASANVATTRQAVVSCSIDGDVDVAQRVRASKHAARCLLALLAVPGLYSQTTTNAEPTASPLLARTVQALCERLHAAATATTSQHDDDNTVTTTTAASSRHRRSRHTTATAVRQPYCCCAAHIVAWLRAVRAIAQGTTHAATTTDAGAAAAAAALRPYMEQLLHSVQTLLQHAVTDMSQRALEVCKVPSHRSRHSSATTATAATAVSSADDAEDGVRDRLATSTAAATTTTTTAAVVTTPRSRACAVVDAAAKALTALALGSDGDGDAHHTATATPTSSTRLRRVVAVLLQAYSTTNAQHATLSAGGRHRRRALAAQLARLLVQPTPDMHHELAVAVLLSSEEDVVVRRGVQCKLAQHACTHDTCDMRYVALLLLTAMSEDSRAGYGELRALVQRVGDAVRARAAALCATLSSPTTAMCCFVEYALPFLVFFMAHHPYYAREVQATPQQPQPPQQQQQQGHALALQRVWHLFFDEVLRHGNAPQCVEVLVELLARVKVADDVLCPTSDATRLLCDLASRVLHECVAQRRLTTTTTTTTSAATATATMSGSGVVVPTLLLPSFFAAPSSPARAQSVLRTVYLDPSVHISAVPPFRAPTAATTRHAATTTSDAVATSDAARDGTKRTRDERDGDDAATAAAADVHDDNDTTAATATSTTTTTRQTRRLRRVVDAVLDEVCGARTRDAIAQLRWRALRDRLLDALHTSSSGGKASTGDDEGTLSPAVTSDMLEYAKAQLRVRYESAPAQ